MKTKSFYRRLKPFLLLLSFFRKKFSFKRFRFLNSFSKLLVLIYKSSETDKLFRQRKRRQKFSFQNHFWFYRAIYSSFFLSRELKRYKNSLKRTDLLKNKIFVVFNKDKKNFLFLKNYNNFYFSLFLLSTSRERIKKNFVISVNEIEK